MQLHKCYLTDEKRETPDPPMHILSPSSLSTSSAAHSQWPHSHNQQHRDHRLTLCLCCLTVPCSPQSVPTICHSLSYTSFANYSSRSVVCTSEQLLGAAASETGGSLYSKDKPRMGIQCLQSSGWVESLANLHQLCVNSVSELIA